MLKCNPEEDIEGEEDEFDDVVSHLGYVAAVALVVFGLCLFVVIEISFITCPCS